MTVKDVVFAMALASSVFLTVHQCTYHLVASAQAEGAACSTVNTILSSC